MKAAVFWTKDGKVTVEEMPPPQLRRGHVLVQTEFSLISAGTERARIETGQQSLIGKARSRPDQVKQVIDTAKQVGLKETYKIVNDRLNTPGLMGYSAAGTVVAAGEGIDTVPGTRVAVGGAGYANHAEVVSVPRNLFVEVPENVDSKWASFATVGAIALRGIHQAEVEPGSRVAVIGLGLVGQLTIRMLQAYGYDALGIDQDPAMLQLAARVGAPVLARSDEKIAAKAVSHWGGEADAVLITAATKSADPVEFAGAIARDRGRVVIVGDVNVAPPRPTYYHKELSIAYSRSYGPGRYDPDYEERGVDYPIGFVRWTEQRNMAEFLRLVATKRIGLEDLDPAVYPIDKADEAYAALEVRGPERKPAILLSYPRRYEEGAADSVVALRPRVAVPTPARATGEVSIAAVGAGSFATRMLLPPLSQVSGVRFAWITTNSGLSALHQGRRWGFADAVATLEAGIEREKPACVMVLTQHDTHAEYSQKVLEAGCGLFVEKPVALSDDEVEEVARAWVENGGPALAGFNRRFAPAISDLKRALHGSGPLQLVYRVFAGRLAPDHWILDPAQGGRIKGEVCHFVDTCGYLAGSPPVSVQARATGGDDAGGHQSVSCIVEYADGSTASIVYGGSTPPGAPKEHLEVAGDRVAARMDNFESLQIWGTNALKKSYRRGPKGHAEEMAALVDLLRGTAAPETDFVLSLWSTLATNRIVDALASGEAAAVVPGTPSLRSALGVTE